MIYDDAFSMYVCSFIRFFFLRRLKFRAAEKKYKKREREREQKIWLQQQGSKENFIYLYHKSYIIILINIFQIWFNLYLALVFFPYLIFYVCILILLYIFYLLYIYNKSFIWVDFLLLVVCCWKRRNKIVY